LEKLVRDRMSDSLMRTNWGILIVFLATMGFYSCAQVRGIEGGPKDEQAPEVVQAQFPSGVLNFQNKSMWFDFNEFIQVQDWNTQLIISPLIQPFPTYKVKGKRLWIEWTDTLEINTTYTFQFGSAIVDLSEGNPANVSHVFSTGNQLDSLKISGQILNAWSKKPCVNCVIQLTEGELNFPTDSKPNYQFKSDKEGFFECVNLPERPFHVVVFDDHNTNNMWDEDEEVDFGTYAILPSNKKDSLIFNTSKSALIEPVLGEVHVDSSGWASWKWDHRLPALSVKIADTLLQADWETEGDSAWVRICGLSDEGYKTVFLTGENFIDSLSIPYFPQKTNHFTPIWTQGKRAVFGDSLCFRTPVLWDIVQPNRIKLMQGNVEMDHRVSKGKYPGFFWIGGKGSGKDVKLVCLPGSFQAEGLSIQSDTVFLLMDILTREEVGQVQFSLANSTKGENLMYLLEMPNGAQQVFRSSSIDNLTLHLVPGDYRIRGFLDTNGNSTWDSIDLYRKTKAEAVFAPIEFQVRANWQKKIVI
jgi:hypothetical protein